jgi:signal transduction histidine kinase
MNGPPAVLRKSSTTTSKRVETLSRTCELTTQLLHVESMEVFLQGITESVRNLFGFDRVSISILDEEKGVFTEPAMAGYSDEERSEALANPAAFSVDEIMEDFREDCRVSKLSYFIPYERQTSSLDSFILVRDAKSAVQARKSPDAWHELDLLYLALCDQRGSIIGYMQVDYPADGLIPSLETIQEIELFAGLAAVGIENSKMFKRTRGYLDLLTHDVGNLITPVDVYLDVVMGTTTLSNEQYRYLSTARESARNITFLIKNLRQSTQSMGGLHTFRMPQSFAMSLRQRGQKTDSDKTGPDVFSAMDMLEILTGIMEVEPLDVLLHRIARAISVQFGMKYVLVGVRDDDTGLFRERVLYGYSSERLMKLARRSYTIERMKYDLREEFAIGPDTYYVRALDTGVVHKDDHMYIDHPELAYVSRKSPSEWQEMDYIDFVVKDKAGNWIGWIELLESTDKKVPSKEVIDRIRILSDLAGIAIENAKLYDQAVGAMNEATGYLDMITHDIGNKLAPLVYYQDKLLSSGNLEKDQVQWLEKSTAIAKSIGDLVFSVKKLSELKEGKSEAAQEYVLKTILEECVVTVRREFPDRRIEADIECPSGDARVMADRFFHELFTNLLRNAVQYDQKPVVEILVKVLDGGGEWIVEIMDHGRGVPDEMKKHIFDRFSKRPDGIGGRGLGLSIASLLVARYKGSIAVKDRIHGKHSEGACFEVRLPKATTHEAELRGEQGLHTVTKNG